jgi:hypothetical protein
MPSMRRSRRAGIAAAEAMVMRERDTRRVDGEEADARRLRVGGQQARKNIGGVRRRKAAARETGGDNIGRRVDAIFPGSVLAGDPAAEHNQIYEPPSLSIRIANNPHYPIHITNIDFSYTLFVRMQMQVYCNIHPIISEHCMYSTNMHLTALLCFFRLSLR